MHCCRPVTLLARLRLGEGVDAGERWDGKGFSPVQRAFKYEFVDDSGGDCPPTSPPEALRSEHQRHRV